MIRFTWYELLGCFHLFFLRMGVGDSSRNSKTEEVCEQRSGEWTVLCDLRYRRSVHDIWITGAKRSLAFFICGDLCDSD